MTRSLHKYEETQETMTVPLGAGHGPMTSNVRPALRIVYDWMLDVTSEIRIDPDPAATPLLFPSGNLDDALDWYICHSALRRAIEECRLCERRQYEAWRRRRNKMYPQERQSEPFRQRQRQRRQCRRRHPWGSQNRHHHTSFPARKVVR